MTMTEEHAVELAEQVYEKYKLRMVKTLESIRDFFSEQGWETEGPFDMSAAEFEWAILVAPPGHDVRKSPHSISIELEIGESGPYGDEPGGVSFKIDCLGNGGYIVGGLAPYNYTDECWVAIDDPDAVEERFMIVEQVSLTSLFNLCSNWEPPKGSA